MSRVSCTKGIDAGLVGGFMVKAVQGEKIGNLNMKAVLEYRVNTTKEFGFL
jgi:hypothetical protein